MVTRLLPTPPKNPFPTIFILLFALLFPLFGVTAETTGKGAVTIYGTPALSPPPVVATTLYVPEVNVFGMITPVILVSEATLYAVVIAGAVVVNVNFPVEVELLP